jgi:hypothetical protein
VNKKGANKVHPHALEKEDLRHVIEAVKGEGFIAPSMVPVAEEGKIESKKRK